MEQAAVFAKSKATGGFPPVQLTKCRCMVNKPGVHGELQGRPRLEGCLGPFALRKMPAAGLRSCTRSSMQSAALVRIMLYNTLSRRLSRLHRLRRVCAGPVSLLGNLPFERLAFWAAGLLVSWPAGQLFYWMGSWPSGQLARWATHRLAN
jgi:hypothetical protein